MVSEWILLFSGLCLTRVTVGERARPVFSARISILSVVVEADVLIEI